MKKPDIKRAAQSLRELLRQFAEHSYWNGDLSHHLDVDADEQEEYFNDEWEHVYENMFLSAYFSLSPDVRTQKSLVHLTREAEAVFCDTIATCLKRGSGKEHKAHKFFDGHKEIKLVKKTVAEINAFLKSENNERLKTKKATSQSGSRDLTLGVDCIAAVGRVGDPIGQALTALGKHSQLAVTDDKTRYYYWHKLMLCICVDKHGLIDHYTVYFSVDAYKKGSVARIQASLAPSPLKTAEGVGAGNTLAEVMGTYPGGKLARKDKDTPEHDFLNFKNVCFIFHRKQLQELLYR